jgi:tRNA pseudouridine13 synthase
MAEPFEAEPPEAEREALSPPLLLPPRVAEAELRPSPEDFLVEEIAAYEPEGEGEHVFLKVKKRGISTMEVSKLISRATGLKERAIGFAGRKDKQGVTTQWMSALTPRDPDEIAGLIVDDRVEILAATRHIKKLRTAHLRGNRFDVRLPGALDDELRARAGQLTEGGFPNLYGAQRFGRDTLDQARRFLALERRAKSRRDRFLMSALQSLVFNRWLVDRMQDGSWNEALDGDVLQKHTTGGMFTCEDPVADTARARAGELSATGPMPGRKMRPAERESLTRESRSLAKLGLDMEELRAHPGLDVGTRRLGRAFPNDLEFVESEAEPRVRFTLPKGSYATVFLRELLGAETLKDAGIRPRAPDSKVQ